MNYINVCCPLLISLEFYPQLEKNQGIVNEYTMAMNKVL